MSSSVDLIFGTSDVRRRILGAFYGTPGLVTHHRELARRLGHPSQVVGRELGRDANVVAYTRGELADLVWAGDPFVADVLVGPRTRITIAADPETARARVP